MGTVEGAARGAPGRASAATGPRTCIRSFRASPDQVREARRFLAQVLGDCPTATDAVACLSELVTNSVLYSNSRRPKGRFSSARPAPAPVEVRRPSPPIAASQLVAGTSPEILATKLPPTSATIWRPGEGRQAQLTPARRT